MSLIDYIVLLKFLSKFELEREKPINLFLTLKKSVFETLKNSTENFSNKLLNKAFGNEDGNDEEESKKTYKKNIHPKDINIVKFKAESQFSPINHAFSFLHIVIGIFIFLLFYIICFIVKYLFFRNRMENTFQFIFLFNEINIDQTNLILSINIFKSYLFNKTIPILNEKNNTEEKFIESFINISEEFQRSIIYTSKTKSFLSGEFLEKYKQYLQGDFTELLVFIKFII